MKVKSRNLVELVLRVVILMTLFIPFYVGYQYWDYEPSIVYHGIRSLEYTETLSWFSALNLGGLIIIIGILFLIALIIGIIFSIRQVMHKGEKSNDKMVAVISVAEILSYFISAIMVLTYTVDADSWYNNVVPSTGFYILSILIISSTALCILGYRQAKKLGIVDSGAPKQEITDVSVELEKYNNLLEKGIITQEEFDAKKKQLLGL